MTTEFPEIFDPKSQEGNSWNPLPVGEYVAQIVEASVLQPKSGDGCYLALTWKIAEGDFEGRPVFHRITFAHSNEQAQAIGRKTLKDLCVALDVNEQVTDAEVFKFKSARIRLGIEKDKQGIYPDKNKVSRIRALESKPAEPGQPANDGSAPAGAAPWHAKR